MGGDNAPQAIIEGAALAVREFDCRIILVGDREIIEPQLDRMDLPDGSVVVKHASEVVGMDEAPRKALVKKRDSSIQRTFDLVKTGEAVVALSAGNSGAAMLSGLYTIGLLPNVDRPCIGSIIPTRDSRAVMVDSGANVDSKPHNLVQFAFMGNALARTALDLPSPRVGLLSIGEEAGKGNETVRGAYHILKKSSLNFVGNIEGGDVFSGDAADVIVCDGFVGNVALKTGEGVAKVLAEALKDEIKSSVLGRVGYIFMRPALKRFKRRFHYAEIGGALLLGINGIGVISHGRSSPTAIKNAILLADKFARTRIDRLVKEEVETSVDLTDLRQTMGAKVHQVIENLKDKKIDSSLKEVKEKSDRKRPKR